jgi:hypothetical protein
MISAANYTDCKLSYKVLMANLIQSFSITHEACLTAFAIRALLSTQGKLNWVSQRFVFATGTSFTRVYAQKRFCAFNLRFQNLLFQKMKTYMRKFLAVSFMLFRCYMRRYQRKLTILVLSVTSES